MRLAGPQLVREIDQFGGIILYVITSRVFSLSSTVIYVCPCYHWLRLKSVDKKKKKNHEAFVAILAQEGFKSNGAGGIRGRGLGDDKKGNMQRDMQGRLYIVLLVHTLLTRNSLDDFGQWTTRPIQPIAKNCAPILFLSRGYAHIAWLLVSRNDSSSGNEKEGKLYCAWLLATLNCSSFSYWLTCENCRKELLSGVLLLWQLMWLRKKLSFVRIRRVIFRQNLWTFCWDPRDCLLYPGVRTFQLFLDICVSI